MSMGKEVPQELLASKENQFIPRTPPPNAPQGSPITPNAPRPPRWSAPLDALPAGSPGAQPARSPGGFTCRGSFTRPGRSRSFHRGSALPGLHPPPGPYSNQQPGRRTHRHPLPARWTRLAAAPLATGSPKCQFAHSSLRRPPPCPARSHPLP